jgi:carboxymethylenebutenolidase
VGTSVGVETADGVADSYFASPGEGYPGVLFLMDAFGLRPTIEEMVERIAGAGYAVLAPNVFYRSGRAPVLPVPDLTDPDARASFFESLRPLIQALGPDEIAADGGSYLDFLADRAAPGPVAITGYCMGARLGWRIAASHPDRVAALGGFHAGGLVTDAPDSPHLSAGDLQAELYLGFADQDPGMSAEQIETLGEALDAAGVRYRSEVYEGAAHGYTMADTAAYDEAARERHFRALGALLERRLSRPT